MNDEPMAILHWDFEHAAWPGTRIKGSNEFREREIALQVAEKLNAEFGARSHWVEVLNHTYPEMLAARRAYITEK